MSQHQPPRPQTRRQPLGEATRRVNNAQGLQSTFASKESLVSQRESLKPDRLLQVRNSPLAQKDYHPSAEFHRGGSPSSNVANPRLSAISKEDPGTDSNRNSQISTASTNASDGKRIKACIGPWKLGKTLGKGATARVRLARHIYTGQEAAIKIVQKKNAQMSQAGSLAALDQLESACLPSSDEGVRSMPIGIEREVAIMKLIQHPNIMKLYDIWENRTEIYLVLEYVDKGELFEHITTIGKLEEEEAMKYFRQILSAVGYCHSFNICHRDLKPENILLTRNGDIKIADFGMAALHQSPDHKLKTSCGSPHYAAPELIRGSTYCGDKVDIWSMGVILYATLAGRLPFDVEGSGKDWIGPLLLKIRKGQYEMAPEFSADAANLIWRILQVNPRDRISLKQIWRHPVVRKYDYLDDYGGGAGHLSPSVTSYGLPVLRRSDISKELLRHLRSLWHTLSEQELMDALLSEKPNDQKLFYGLFLKYRDAQLEDYTPDVGYSASDYHHVRPLALTKTYSTRQFSQPKSKGHRRQTSRFTVISNVAETEQSYDPFKASRPQHLDSIRAPDKPKVTIHRTRRSTHERDAEIEAVTKPLRLLRASGSVTSGSERGRQSKLAPPRAFVSRSSLASSTRSRSTTSYMRVPSRHRRGVDFSHVRRRSAGSQPKVSVSSVEALERPNNLALDYEGEASGLIAGSPTSTRYIRSRKGQTTVSQPLLSIPRPARTSQLWTDDVRQLSSSLAKDCDEAFNRPSVAAVTEARRNSKALSSFEPSQFAEDSSTLHRSQSPSAAQRQKSISLHNRPLPAPPTRTDSVKIELIEARLQAELRKRKTSGDESHGYLDRMVSHIDRLIQPLSPSPTKKVRDNRISSAPVDKKHITSMRPLPSIYEGRKEEGSPSRTANYAEYKDRNRRDGSTAGRIASAPEPRSSNRDYEDPMTRLSFNVRDTICVVNPSSCPGSPADIPAPLTIRKKSSQVAVLPSSSGDSRIGGGNGNQFTKQQHTGLENQQDYRAESSLNVSSDLGPIEEADVDDQFADGSNSGTIVRKRSTWFKRSSKSGDGHAWKMSIGGGPALPSQASSNDIAQTRPGSSIPLPPKKDKGFNLGRIFGRRSPKTDMAIGGDDIFDQNESDDESALEARRSRLKRSSKIEDHKPRQIEPQRNWLAKLFNVKPATKYICFATSKRKARQEISAILKEWKRYGIRNVQVDKERNIVFARVAAKNYLDLKEVAFAGEVMTVIEHGKRSQLSIARFTQERGAASSFHKVVETLETVLKSRGLLVADERRKRRMVKTLTSA